MQSREVLSGVPPAPSPHDPGGVVKWILIPVLIVLALGSAAIKKYLEIKNHIAPVSTGAVPERIGCDVGCDLLNRFEGWQPYLHRVVEVARRDYQCKRVDYVSVSDESVNPDNPKFFVVCDGENGKTYITQHFKKVIDMQYRKLSL